MRIQAEAEQAASAARLSAASSAIAPAMDDAAVVHHAHVVAELLRDAEILLDQQDGRAACA